MEQVKQLTDAELDGREYRRFEREYEEWCKKFEPNYIVEQEEEEND
jgi:hypothetical protein